MEFKVNRETISAAECVYEGIQEQGIEMDYILPDYYPDVFKLVRCEAVPVISDYSVNGDKLTYELRCDMRILYCSENGSILQCVNQKQTFSKTVDMGRFCDNPSVTLKPKCDYVNCRAVNKRRLDMRGAVSVKVSVTGERNQEIISDAFGMNIQMKRMPIEFASKKITARKNIQLGDDIELSSTQPSIVSVVRCSCTSISCEKKMISGKMLAKGDASIAVLYACERDGAGVLEPMEFTVPYSQIIDLDGIDDTFECCVKPEIVFCEVNPVQNKEGENRSIRCEMEILLNCSAVKTTSVTLGVDAYSTTYPCSIAVTEIKAEQIPKIINHEIHHCAKMCEGEDVPEQIFYVWCTPKNVNANLNAEEKKLMVSGMLTYTAAARDNSGMIIMPDKEEAFEEVIELNDDYTNAAAAADIIVNGVSYNISSDNVLTLKADIKAEISIFTSSSVKALSDISVDEGMKKIRDGDYAIKLYYGAENEDIWEIAKRYSTCVTSIIEENELSGERLEESGMLIIPIVS